jgi:hypothetical protein
MRHRHLLLLAVMTALLALPNRPGSAPSPSTDAKATALPHRGDARASAAWRPVSPRATVSGESRATRISAPRIQHTQTRLPDASRIRETAELRFPVWSIAATHEPDRVPAHALERKLDVNLLSALARGENQPQRVIDHSPIAACRWRRTAEGT